ncbi:unnamed protein product, partial [Iphiclides podalirius]
MHLQGYPCRVCGRRFNQSGHLAIHMRMHTGERPYPCDLCPKAFKVKSRYNVVTTNTDCIKTGPSAAFEKRSDPASPLRFFHAPTCETGRQVERDDHRRTHTGERPFACNACPKTFTAAARLREHARIHTDQRLPVVFV